MYQSVSSHFTHAKSQSFHSRFSRIWALPLWPYLFLTYLASATLGILPIPEHTKNALASKHSNPLFPQLEFPSWRYLPGQLLHFLQIFDKMSPCLPSPHQHELACLHCFVFLFSTFNHYIYFIYFRKRFSIYILLSKPQLPNYTRNISSLGAGIFFCFVNCCLPSTWDCAWDMADAQIFVKWMNGQAFPKAVCGHGVRGYVWKVMRLRI